MIGHFLLTLSPTQEDRVLTNFLAPGSMMQKDGSRCLVGVAEDWHCDGLHLWPRNPHPAVARLRDLATFCAPPERHWWPTSRFDDLCARFGTERINRVIRDRILANQLRRALHGVDVPASV